MPETTTPAKTTAPVRMLEGSARPLFRTTLRQILFAKKTPLLALVLLIPAAVTLILFPYLDDGRYETFSGDQDTVVVTDENAGRLWFEDSTVVIYLGILVPLVSAFYATGLIGDEVANKTLPYIFIRPVRRWSVLLSKFTAFYVGTLTLTAGGLIITFFLALSATQNPFTSLDTLFVGLGVVALAVLANGALFALMGVGLRFPLVFAVVYFLLWENIFGAFPAQIKRFTLIFYERSMVMNAGGRGDLVGDVNAGLAVETWAAVLILAGVGILLVAASALVVSLKDYNV